ncbi:MAG: kelch repeat-containing protein [Thermoplasmata archaeon]
MEAAPAAPGSFGPSPRDFHDMAYDAESDRIVLYGGIIRGSGQTSADVSDETWAYNFEANTWTQMNPPAGPGPRSSHGMAYDAESDRIILFAGAYGQGDTWAYDLNNDGWTKMNPPDAPEQRVGHRMAYVSESDLIVLHGGHRARPVLVQFFDTWTYDYNTDTWTNVTLAGGPTHGNHNALAYDSESDLIVLFGGERGTVSDETWVFGTNSTGWANADPTPRPPAGWALDMAYDAMSDTTVLFPSGSNATWTYDANGNMWTSIATENAPQSRSGHRLAYDAESDRVILFGGISAGKTNETWAFDTDAARWTPLTLPSAPTLSASADDRSVELSWAAPSSAPGITNYRIHRGTASGDLALLVELEDIRTYSDGDVNYGVRYYYQVAAVNTLGEGPASNEVSVMPADDIPPAVTIASPTAGATVASASISVAGPGTDHDAEDAVEIGLDGANWVPATRSGSSWSGTLTLEEGTNTIHARAIDPSGNDASTSVCCITYSPTPDGDGNGDGNGTGLDPVVIAAIIGGVVVAAVAVAIFLFRRRS